MGRADYRVPGGSGQELGRPTEVVFLMVMKIASDQFGRTTWLISGRTETD